MQISLSKTCFPFTVYWALMNTKHRVHTLFLYFIFKHVCISLIFHAFRDKTCKHFLSLFNLFFFFQYCYLVGKLLFISCLICLTCLICSGCDLSVVVWSQEIHSPWSSPSLLQLFFLLSLVWLDSLSIKRKQVRKKH